MHKYMLLLLEPLFHLLCCVDAFRDQGRIQDVVKERTDHNNFKNYFVQITFINDYIITLLLIMHKLYRYRLYNYAFVNGFRHRSRHGWCTETPWLYTYMYIFWVQFIISTMRHSDYLLCGYFVCALHAVAANCEHTGGNNIMLTFHFRTAVVLRKGNGHFASRFKKGKGISSYILWNATNKSS